MMFMRSFPAIVFLLQGVCTLAAEAESVHWHQFRGPNGAGTAAGFKPPLKIVAQQAAWRTPLPPGKSSPVLWGERIYVTGVESNRLATVALDSAEQAIESRSAPESATRPICPMFIVNARVDELTPAEKCVEFYASLLKAGVNAEIHVFSKGGHGFGMGAGRGNSTALWPTSFVAWLRDCGIVED